MSEKEKSSIDQTGHNWQRYTTCDEALQVDIALFKRVIG